METEIVNVTTIKSIFTPGEVAGIFDVRWAISINFVFYEFNYNKHFEGFCELLRFDADKLLHFQSFCS